MSSKERRSYFSVVLDLAVNHRRFLTRMVQMAEKDEFLFVSKNHLILCKLALRKTL